VDSADADEHTPPRGATATSAESAARIGRKVKAETKTVKCILSGGVEIEGSITFQKELLIDGKSKGRSLLMGF
jgi:cytoskeletal protein CcmA (bactofilin family)